MNAVIALAKKDLQLMLRDKFALFWILAFPIMFALFFGAIYGGDSGGGRGRLSLAVVDEDGSESSTAFVEELEASESLRVALRKTKTGDVPYDAESAREAVQKGSLTAYLRIPADYGEQPFVLFGGGGDGPKLEIGIDPTRSAEAGFLQGIMMESLVSSMGLGGGGDMPQPFDLVDVTRSQENEPRSTFDVTFPQALVWGLMSVAMGFAITFVRERTSGTLLRLRAAPIGDAQLLGGKALACYVGCLATMTVILAFGFLALGVRFDSVPLLLLAMLATSFCFTGVMMTISVLGKTEPAVAGASWGLMMPFAMIGGGMIPLMVMPEWLAKLSVISPFTWAITAVEGAAWRGFDLIDMVLPCCILVAMGLVFFALGVTIVRRIDA